MTTDPLRGVVLVLLAASLWGTTGLAQSLSGGALGAAWFGALRLTVAALFFAAVAATAAWAAKRTRGAMARSIRSHSDRRIVPLPLFVGSGLCMAAYNLMFFAGIRHTGVALGTALALGSGPLWAGVIQSGLDRRWPAATWWTGTSLAVCGGALMTGVGRTQAMNVNATGMLLCLGAGLSYAVYTLLVKQLAAVAPASSVTLRAFTVAALVAMPLAWLDAGLPTIRWADAWAVLYVGLVTSGVAYLLFSMALRHISAASGVTLALFEPVVACLLAAAVLGESVRALAWAGLGLVLLGVILVMRAELPLAAGPICGTAGRRYRGPPTAEIETLASKDDWGIGMGATPRPKPRRAHDRAR